MVSGSATCHFGHGLPFQRDASGAGQPLRWQALVSRNSSHTLKETNIKITYTYFAFMFFVIKFSSAKYQNNFVIFAHGEF